IEEVFTRPAELPVADALPVAQPVHSGRTKRSDDGDIPEALPVDKKPPERRGALLRMLPFLPVAFLVVGLGTTFSHDLSLWISRAVGGRMDEQLDDNTPRLTLRFHENEERVGLGTGGIKPDGGGGATRTAFWEPSMRFGLTTPNQDKALFKRGDKR